LRHRAAKPSPVTCRRPLLLRLQVFDFAAWTEHRSVSRYNKDMQGILTSRIVRGLAPPLIYTAAGALTVSLYESLQESGVLAQYIPGIPFPDLAVSVDGPFSISTFALSLLLVFRTNSSYERWWEAMTAWGKCVQVRAALQGNFVFDVFPNAHC
jgi:hypothetical protein